MRFLVDANVLSELTKPRFAQRVVDWLNANEASLAVDAVILGEIWRGVDALPEGRRKEGLARWFEQRPSKIPCLAWTAETAVIWGEMVNRVKRAGHTVGLMDTMIAATARLHGLTVATLNVDDFSRCGVPVVNPFE